MNFRTWIVVGASLALLSLGACKKDENKDEGGGGESGEASGEGGAAKGAEGGGGGAMKMTAAEFFADYSSLDGAGAFSKYGGKQVEISGKVKKTITEMDESMAVWLDVDGTKWVSLSFKDSGAAAKEKGLAEGADATAVCDVAGMADNYIMMNDCELK